MRAAILLFVAVMVVPSGIGEEKPLTTDEAAMFRMNIRESSLRAEGALR